MQIFNQLFSKIIGVMLFIILLAGGYIFLVRKLVKPPQIASNQPIPNTSATTTNSNPTVVQSSVASNADNILPAIAQPDGVVIDAPEKLEPGGILKVYTNTDKTEHPNPLNSSPTKVVKTDGLEMMNVAEESTKYQQAEGYFLVPETDEYNFVVEFPKSYKDVEIASLNMKVDGVILSEPQGGKVHLEEGYHKISLLNNYAVKGKYPTVNWAATGEEVKPLKVFREIKTQAEKQ